MGTSSSYEKRAKQLKKLLNSSVNGYWGDVYMGLRESKNSLIFKHIKSLQSYEDFLKRGQIRLLPIIKENKSFFMYLRDNGGLIRYMSINRLEAYKVAYYCGFQWLINLYENEKKNAKNA